MISKPQTIIDQYIDAKATLSNSTLRVYRITLNQFSKFCDDRGTTILDANESDVANYLDQFDFIKTKQSYKKTLSAFFKWTIKNKISFGNPTEDIKIKNGRKKKHQLMKEADFQVILNQCQGLREQTIITFLWYTGVRAKELISIKLQDIDLHNDLIYVSQSKTEGGLRHIPIHPKLKPILVKYLEISDKMRVENNIKAREVFLHTQGKKFAPRTIIHFITKLQKNIDSDFTCHDFRRAFITNVFNVSKDIVLAQELAGHAEVSTTRGYILSNPEAQAKRFKALSF